MSKKILVISNMYPTEAHKTFGIFVKNQAESLREHGQDVDVIAIRDPRNGKWNVLKKYGFWLGKALLILLTRRKRYNVVHAHYVFPSGLIALLFKKIGKVPYVVTAHGGDIDKMAKKSHVIKKWTGEILQQSSHVIAVGNGLKNDIMKDFHVPEEKITVLNMGVDRKVFKPFPKIEAKKELLLPTDRKAILFVGNIIREKGVMELLQAFTLLNQNKHDLDLHLIGASRDQKFRNELEEIIAENKLNSLYFHPPLPQEQLAKWMAAADVFVLPSYIEGFGLVALEAMSCHTPVIATNVGGLTYLVGNGAGKLVEPKNSTQLAEAIASVLYNIELQSSMVENGERKAQENDSEVVIERLLNIYRENGLESNPFKKEIAE
ncbi:MAG TPA: glycosyltransferase family 4 protein [Bacillus sp. (in: firmicutes)]|uniref:glycosyltransferase family 4 protein n=1 Tax=Bacillus litorisediminis TaxID=2922713 RepID=UPI001FAF9360|nr:glycosyltransferase family 4 protein [Bacillus litorisediminis]HWO77557.1 glycosyltransferase family 4 protein [Bacillus sp. (in: firmicutes)]